ncbi:SDR family NAD(P)-dependent oxidoreductase [Pseudarthrobacter niigatensis]|uniref:3-oxoacyl-[acyl-carrier protein] reductase n=1 Tax=Pseudarthrobacter niigatensis TaxID=369935 RepID=A0AAJ1SU55_9MICC|nr:SDR family NAD(P)-dependent oxidoreductase [Pseudarthrobacter niigatensis]MDQ0147337.1 3-oxoacyl-[acyl-carrier protein] reductase [Pseudarthrobacter niigatensis]MDQ0267154.1 3-oxoacyl-[acyl-carrier protein] reductase [Pseudarthrobacter niigatensis]
MNTSTHVSGNAQAANGRGIVVTGGSSGIGKAIAEAFLANGDRVAVLDRAGGDGAIRVDVADETSVRAAFAEAREALGGIDVLVNSAGLLTESPLEDMSLAMWNETLTVDLTGVFLCCREVVGEMRQRKWGRIINIASQLAIKGGVGLAHYSAAKAGVVGLSKALALETAPDNVLVNCIAPGPIETPLVEGISESWKAAKRAELPLGRFGTPAEVAPAALLLASDPGGNLFVGQMLGPNSGDVMP